MNMYQLATHLNVDYNKLRIYRQRYKFIWFLTESVMSKSIYEEGQEILMRDLERIFWDNPNSKIFNGLDFALFGGLEIFEPDNLKILRDLAADIPFKNNRDKWSREC